MRTYIPRPWPNKAKGARDDAATAIAAALKIAVCLAETEQDTERLRKYTKIINLLQNALRLLESVGACTKPCITEL